jgi:hypothetical protein
MRQGSFMGADGVGAADELEALRQLKARYCRFLDTKDVESWRNVPRGPHDLASFVPMVMASLDNAATMHLQDWLVFDDGRELHGAGHYHETLRGFLRPGEPVP